MQRRSNRWWAFRRMARRARVGLHATHPYGMVSTTSVLSIRTLSRSGAVGWSYSGKPYRLKRRLASITRRLIRAVRLSFSHTVCPPRYTNLVCSCTSSAGSLTKVALPTRFVSRHMVSVLAPETVNPNEQQTATIFCILFARLFSSTWERCPRRLHTAFPRSVAAPPQSPGVYVALSRPPSLLILHLGAHYCPSPHLHYSSTKPLHRHTQYGSNEHVEQPWCEHDSLP